MRKFSEQRTPVSVGVTDNLRGAAFKERGPLVRRALERAVERLRAQSPGLQVDWSTVSTSGQLVVGTAPSADVPILSSAGRQLGILVDPIVERDVAL